MIQRVVSIPEALIQRRFDRRGVSLEVIAVLVYGLLGAIGKIYFAFRLSESITNDVSRLTFSLVGQVLGPIVLILVIWVVYTVLAHFIGKLYNGRGRIVRLLRTTAWSLAPIGLWLLLRSIVQIVILFQYDYPETLNEFGGVKITDQIANVYGEAITNTGWSGPLSTATELLSVLFIAWAGYYFAQAIEQTMNVDEDDARKVAAVPSALLALYFIQGALL